MEPAFIGEWRQLLSDTDRRAKESIQSLCIPGVYTNSTWKHKKGNIIQLLFVHVLTRAQTSLAQHCWELVGFGNWDKLHAFQVLVWGNIHNCTVLMHVKMIRNHLWKAVLLHCLSFFSLLFLLLDFTLKKNRKPYKRNNPAMEKTELTVFKIQLKPKQLRSALFCGTDCPLPAVSRIDFIQRCNAHSVPTIFSRNTRYQENLIEVTRALCI